jgi:hypothetical protein
MPKNQAELVRPAQVCQSLLAALDASEGRRRRRKRDTTPDAIGLGIKRHLLQQAVREDPAPEEFEHWLLRRAMASDAQGAAGAVAAMARAVFEEWRMAHSLTAFKDWLDRGAPSDDANEGTEKPRRIEA